MNDPTRGPLNYEPKLTFDEDTKSLLMQGPSAHQVAHDMHLAFMRDVDGKIRAALIAMGWMPPEIAGEFKAAFRANMLRRAQPGEDIAHEIDRVFAKLGQER